MTKTILGPDKKNRCSWSGAAPEFIDYHDHEWGFPVLDDRSLFEKLCLESFQSGLSWRTILNKRDSFRVAFSDFDLERVANYGQRDVTRLLKDASIVRNRAKIEAVIDNAGRALRMVEEEGSLAAFFWSYEPTVRKSRKAQSETTCAESVALAKELKRRRWKFLGPTTLFAFFQAMGLINDHVPGCYVQAKVEKARKALKRPKRR